MKSWNETKTNDSWSLFKIMSEFLSGYEKLSSIGPCISIFGSARTKSNHPTYILTVEIAKAIAKSGYGVITGGGPGIMEAANKGASEVGGISVGLNINSPIEQESNKGSRTDELFNAIKKEFSKDKDEYKLFDTDKFKVKTLENIKTAINKKSLKQSGSRKIKSLYKKDVDPERIMIMPGGKPTMYYAIQMIGEPGAEIVHPTPGFPIYESMICLLYTSPSPRDRTRSRMPSSA